MTGFRTARGRGYSPQQVDRVLAALGRERDEAWRRLAEVGLRADRLGERAAALRAEVAALPEPDFSTLGERAELLLAEVVAEATGVRESAEADAEALLRGAEEFSRALRERAAREAAQVRVTAEAEARRALDEADAEGRGLLERERARAARVRATADAALADVARHAEALLAEQRSKARASGRLAEERMAARSASVEARVRQLTERADAVWEQARRELAEAEGAVRARNEAAEARRAELLADAEARRLRIEQDAERMLRLQEERADQVRAYMTHLRTTLAALTGRAPRRPAVRPLGEPAEEAGAGWEGAEGGEPRRG
ncbi:cellulose-binding protein [Streptomyces profundus]|uniref:cellulose-binding protein n=1 Tax=Streptomyces profundus TaxID=2867410 RepID=UPI001D1655C9|nr:cellulose-binding protein [Streptomyces sp. MA3_2.13]UED85916.1 cellulose-binding protein [Streptomyces sp. MA3_2.13]